MSPAERRAWRASSDGKRQRLVTDLLKRHRVATQSGIKQQCMHHAQMLLEQIDGPRLRRGVRG